MPKIDIPYIIFKANGEIKSITEPITSSLNVAKKTHDVFKKSNSVPTNNTYLADVVYEKTGFIFHKIKATFQGKPIATTKAELFEQLNALKLDEDYFRNETRKKQFINDGISDLKKTNLHTISSISKFILEINTPENKDFETILKQIWFNPKTLSTITKVLNHPRNLCLKDASNIVAKTSSENYKFLDILLNTDSIKLKNNSIAPLLNVLPLAGEAKSDNIAIISRITAKLENIEDEKIKKFVISKLSNPLSELNSKLKIPQNCFIPENGVNELEKCEMLLDAYHCEKNHYSVLNGDAHEYFKYLRKKVVLEFSTPADLVEFNEIKTVDSYPKIGKYNFPQEISQATLFNEAVRLEPLKNFCAKYSESESEMTNYLYEHYFLSKIDSSLRERFKMLSDEMGTKTFVENRMPIYTLSETIKSEFKNWKDANNSKTKLPTIFDLSHAKQPFINAPNKVSGYYKPIIDSINIPTQEFWCSGINDTIRHEMTHLNDSEFSTKGMINGINIDVIIKTRQYESELENAGITDLSYLDYAYKNKREFIAVASEGDYTKYSQEFKDVLVKLGMPEYVFNLKLLPSAIPNQNFAKILNDKFIKSAKNEDNCRCNTSLPNGIMLAGLKNFKLQEVAKWMANESKCELKKIDFEQLSRDEVRQGLVNILHNAKENNKRTIVQIENFEKYTTPTDENRKIVGVLKTVLNSCANDYNCTLITAADDLSKIDSGVMADQRFKVQINASN